MFSLLHDKLYYVPVGTVWFHCVHCTQWYMAMITFIRWNTHNTPNPTNTHCCHKHIYPIQRQKQHTNHTHYTCHRYHTRAQHANTHIYKNTHTNTHAHVHTRNPVILTRGLSVYFRRGCSTGNPRCCEVSETLFTATTSRHFLQLCDLHFWTWFLPRSRYSTSAMHQIWL